VLGSLLSHLVRRLLPMHSVLVLELWVGLTCGLFVIWPSVYVLAAGMLPSALAIPSTDSVVHGYRIAMTPDRLLGRSEAVRSTVSLLIAPLGPLVAGLLLQTVSARLAVAVFVSISFVLAVWGTLSPASGRPRGWRTCPATATAPDGPRAATSMPRRSGS